MIDNVLKYGTSNLIILYYYIYFELSGTVKVVV